MRRARAAQRGITLLELIVSTACSGILLTAGVMLTVGHSKVLGRTAERTEVGQAARLTMDLLASDVRMAGVGVGYRPDGSFGGLRRGQFTVLGGATFDATDHEIQLRTGSMTTDDIGIRHATGRVRTIADFDTVSGQVCTGSGLEEGDIAVLMTREGLHARTVRITSLAGATCTGGTCVDGCDRFGWTADESYVSDAYALEASFIDGELMADYAEIVWFVTPNDEGDGMLRRAEIDAQNRCAARDTSCGGNVTVGVESLQVALWQWDSEADEWVNRTQTGDVTDRDRIRVDLEIVLRGRKEHRRAGGRADVELALADDQCVPGPCGAQRRDGFERRVLRTSVEVRNSGRMQIK